MPQRRTASAILALAMLFGGTACEASGNIDDEGGEVNVDVGENGEGGGE